MSSGYEIWHHLYSMDPALSRDIDWYCSLPDEPPTPEWDVCVGLTPETLHWFCLEEDQGDRAVEYALEHWEEESGEVLGPDEELIWQLYRNGELIDEEMLGVYPEKVNRL